MKTMMNAPKPSRPQAGCNLKFIAFAISFFCSHSFAAPNPSADYFLGKIAAKSAVCVLPDQSDPSLALEIASKGDYRVLMQSPDYQKSLDYRKEAGAKKLLGKITAIKGVLGKIGVADNYADLLILTQVTDATLAGISGAELQRVLSPVHGRAIIGGAKSGATKAALEAWAKQNNCKNAEVEEKDDCLWLVFSKPMAEGVDDWAHWFHGPDNNNVSSDSVLKYPYLTQWTDLPWRGPQPRVSLVCNGRLYSAAAAMGKERNQELFSNCLEARNIFNGQVLWKKKLPDYFSDFRLLRSGMVAMPDSLYMADMHEVIELDGATGVEKRRIAATSPSREVKWMAIVNDSIFVLSGDKDMDMRDSKNNVSLGFLLVNAYPTPPVGPLGKRYWGAGDNVASFDLKSGTERWKHAESGAIDCRRIAIGNGRIYYYAEKTHAACLDAATGKLTWENQSPDVLSAMDNVLVDESGGKSGTPKVFGHTGLQTATPGILAMPEAVLFNNTKDLHQILMLAAATGEKLWSEPVSKDKSMGHPIFVDGKLVVSTNAVDIKTGAFSKGAFPPCSGSGCGPVNASKYGLYGRHGIGYDLITKKSVDDNATRGGCWQNCIPADGLLVTGPYQCGCPYSIRGFIIQSSAGDFPLNKKATDEDRLITMPNHLTVENLPLDGNDWPTCRANNLRTASTPVSLSATGSASWTLEADIPCELTAPVAAGKYVYVGDNLGRVRCIDTTEKNVKWTYYTGSKIFMPPTVAAGRVFAGSGDGCVHAMEAASGRPLWVFQAAPENRFIRLYGHMTNSWPVNSGVLEDNGTVYAAAGFIDRDGTYVYALDAVTGKIKWQNNESWNIDKEARKGASVQGHLTIAGGFLWMQSGDSMTPVGYDLKTGAHTNPGYKILNVYGNMPRGENIGIMADKFIVHGSRSALYMDPDESYSERKDRLYFGEFSSGTMKYPVCSIGTSVMPAWDGAEAVSAIEGKNTISIVKSSIADVVSAVSGTISSASVPPLSASRTDISKHKFFFLEKAKTDPPQQWSQPFGSEKNKGTPMIGDSIVMTKNAVLVMGAIKSQMDSSYFLAAMDRGTGKKLWEMPLPDVHARNGICVTRDGAVIVALANGTIICSGK